MADLIYSGPTDSADGAAGAAPGAPMAHGANDPSQVSGQDPASFLGIPFSYSTGLGGSPPGNFGGSDDPTNEPGQYPPAKPLVAGDFYPDMSGAGEGNVLVGGFKKGRRG